MHIIICDDNKVECEILKGKVFQYFEKHNIEIKIDVFYSAKSILDQTEKFDIIFMDIEFEKENGLQVINEYRKDHFSINILVTSHREQMPNGYRAKAFRFLCKPINDFSLKEALDSALIELNTKKKFVVESDFGMTVIYENEIIYIEAGDKYIGIRTKENFYRMKGTISGILKELNPFDFIIPHRTYIVNMNYISAIDNRFVYIHNGEKIKISRLKKKEFQEKFFSFIREKARNGQFV